MYVCMYVSRVLDRQLVNGWCHRHQNRSLCSRPHSHELVIFSYFWDSYFLSYGEFKMHAMKLRVQALRAVLTSGARRALPLVGGASVLCTLRILPYLVRNPTQNTEIRICYFGYGNAHLLNTETLMVT